MTDESLPARLLPSPDGDHYAPAPSAPSISPVQLLLRALRGRYPWALGIGAVLAVSGGLAGAFLPRPVYRCTGMIEIAPTVPRILYASEEKGVPPMFESYVSAQATLVTSRRVVDIAMATPEWRRFGRGLSDASVAAFQSSLSCENPRRSHFLAVSFLDGDPDAAKVAVNQVVTAYMRIVDERERESGTSRYRVLLGEQSQLSNRLQSLRADVLAATDGYGATAIEKRYAYLLEQLNRDDVLIHELDLEISAARDAGTPAPADPGRDPTPEELSVVDDTLNSLLLQQQEKEKDIEFLTTVEGRGANHPLVTDAARELEQIRLRVRERAERVLELRASGGAPLLAVQAIAAKEKRRDRIKLLRESAADESKLMSSKLFGVANLQAEQNAALDGLEQIKRRIAQIDLESESPGRISIMNRGDRPVAPHTDRRLALAAFGGGGGLALGFVAVALWGLRNARIRHIADVDGPAARERFLGILPELAEEAGGDEPARGQNASGGMADYCVHHVRTMLQLGHASPGRVVAFTSPSPGAGKTTLAYAVGCSFGASGARTLVIDCDLIGHGLTSSLADLSCEVAREFLLGGADGARGKEGFVRRILAGRRTRTSERDLEELRAACRAHPAVLDPDFDRIVRSVESAARHGGARADGANPRRGLLDALTGTPLDDCVVETCFPNVWVLPVGEATERDAERLSPAGLDRLLAACRSRFDVILVDTGPILGSLEAAFVTVKADDVVLVVPRGELKSVVDGATKRLESAGARVAGVVFNRARPEDAARSSFASRPSDDAADAE